MKKILYVHGLEGNAKKGKKAKFCREQYNAITPQMPATLERLLASRKNCIEECYKIIEKVVKNHEPDLIIGSSFGGGITMALMQRGVYKGDAILLAPAGVKYGLSPELPSDYRVLLIHDPKDKIVPYEDSVKILESNKSCELWDADCGHRLITITTDGMLDKAIEKFTFS